MQERLAVYQTLTRVEQPDEGVEVDEKNDQIALRRIGSRTGILRNHERNSVRQRQLRMQSMLCRSFEKYSMPVNR